MPASSKPSIKPVPQISVNGKVIAYKQSKQSLLECLEQAGVEVHYHCRDGFCGACRVTLASGEISYPDGEPLAFIGENEILPCCCVPVTDISLKIDE
ncbi:class I ribonucleotide reductase maintenance protein YfaE [Colwellia sp. 4_MG-2023]|uniref:class I ribonucleotide reductase maintenance protein YfaE n=1 Tax=unclassified Colwellia TaxID=196834 RepID=UPI0026E31DC5|nr:MULTISPECIES: class I ribonucleotide reductase maintenance protein YfaE [unclassified Colwellia]MDO6508055.1 class I ribonucleotide reductase maintenance protein YfaE [Colwellia sp. 5_MG-2023]MDO6556766.1 class I ribonucleotide reductase maintenance protein YfaE [Colwellia sp. 4_MG-2023]